jgi:protein-tyrosine phosphatase
MSDPTAILIEEVPTYSDPFKVRVRGWSSHGNMRIDTPYITPVVDGLYHGGVQHGLILPKDIKYVLSLYKWEAYMADPSVEVLTVTMLDSLDQELDGVEELAAWVNARRERGNVLVHCQAGLNRSSLVVATALVRNGDVKNGAEAIELMRAQRTPAVLCNPAFEEYVRSL